MDQWNVVDVYTDELLHHNRVPRAGAALREDGKLKYPILNMLSCQFCLEIVMTTTITSSNAPEAAAEAMPMILYRPVSAEQCLPSPVQPSLN